MKKIRTKMLSVLVVLLASATILRAADPEGFGLWKGAAVKNSGKELASKIDDQKFAWQALGTYGNHLMGKGIKRCIGSIIRVPRVSCASCAISAGRITIQSTAAGTSAFSKNRGSGGAADGCNPVPELSAGAASLLQRPDHDLPERRSCERAWPRRTRGLFAHLRQSIAEGS